MKKSIFFGGIRNESNGLKEGMRMKRSRFKSDFSGEMLEYFNGE